MTFLRCHIADMMRSTRSQRNVTIWTDSSVNTERFSLKMCFKVPLETVTIILKLITITFVMINYEVEFLFLCQDVLFNDSTGVLSNTLNNSYILRKQHI